MIEIKVSQGAKPGHGGILPAEKNTPEIAEMRQVKPYTTIFSPGHHSVFDGPEGLIDFIHTLRDLSCGKPIGFKMCMGDPSEFDDLCKIMKEKISTLTLSPLMEVKAVQVLPLQSFLTLLGWVSVMGLFLPMIILCFMELETK